jgi:hypothetical protein
MTLQGIELFNAADPVARCSWESNTGRSEVQARLLQQASETSRKIQLLKSRITVIDPKKKKMKVKNELVISITARKTMEKQLDEALFAISFEP